jgi:hypothetical protein
MLREHKNRDKIGERVDRLAGHLGREKKPPSITRFNQRVIDAIYVLTQRLERPPNFRELAKEIDRTVGAVHPQVEKLREMGVVHPESLCLLGYSDEPSLLAVRCAVGAARRCLSINAPKRADEHLKFAEKILKEMT